jgi:Tol biopolymer transport system component
MIDHAQLRERLAYYRDLTPDERREVDTHLRACAECRAVLAEHQRQDGLLASIPELHPRRALRPRRVSRSRMIAARLGDALALGGLAALMWAFALRLQAMSQPGGAPASALPEPGVVIPPTSVQPPSPWIGAMPWLAGALLVVGVLFIFSRRSLWPVIVGAVLSAGLLTSFVPPFSALPNPAAFYWRAVGGYSYDPRLPFKNNYLIAGDPARDLKPHLDQLLGKIGLSPLDPVQPLARYEILRVGLHPRERRVALVTTRFIYADGASRVYPVPLLNPVVSIGDFWLSGWRDDGLQRLRSDHLAFPGQPFATPDSPIRLGPARRLDLNPAANRLDELNPAHWLWNSVRLQHLVWAPDGSAFLLAVETDPGQRQLYRVPLDGSPPAPVAMGDIREYGWSPDGGVIVFTGLDPEASAADPTRPYAVMAAPVGSRAQPYPLVTALATDKLPGLTPGGAWFFANDALWLAPYNGQAPQSLISALASPLPPHPSPDGSRVAYACGRDLCLQNVDGGDPVRILNVRPDEAAWSRDGQRLAVVDRDPNNLRPVCLIVLDRAGAERLRVPIAPRDVTDPPQWTPGGGAILVQTFPQDGRRIIAVDVASGQVMDLSQEHWDAYFALSPDGRALLLNNGRGDFWLADVVR